MTQIFFHSGLFWFAKVWPQAQTQEGYSKVFLIFFFPLYTPPLLHSLTANTSPVSSDLESYSTWNVAWSSITSTLPSKTLFSNPFAQLRLLFRLLLHSLFIIISFAAYHCRVFKSEMVFLGQREQHNRFLDHNQHCLIWRQLSVAVIISDPNFL